MGRYRLKNHDSIGGELLTTGQVAMLFQVNFKTVLGWAKTGQIKSSRLPGKRGDFRFSRVDVMEFSKRAGLPMLSVVQEREPLVLVVDDEALIASAIRRAIPRHVKLIHASNGYEAGILMALRSPDLVFLDLHMPHLNGFEVLAHMKFESNLKRIPVCVLSGQGQEALERARQMGADFVVPKPFELADIRAILSEAVPVAMTEKDKTEAA